LVRTVSRSNDVESEIYRLPGNRVVVDDGENARPRRILSVGSHPIRRQHPIVTVAVPDAVEVAAFRVEGPGTEPAGNRVPPDALRALHHLLSGNGHGEFTQQKTTVVNRR